MKLNVLWVVVALVAGFVLGGWGLRSDLGKSRAEVKSLQAKAGKSAKRSADIDGIRTMLRLPDNTPAASPSRQGRMRRHPHAQANVPPAVQAPPQATLTNTVTNSVPPTNRVVRQHKSMSEDLKEASELWRTRVALARNSFISNVELDQDHEAKFDVVVNAMNIRLGDGIAQWAEYLKATGELVPEDGIRMVNDLSAIMVLTYDELDRNMPPDWRNKAGDNFQLFNFIDPDTAMPLAEVEGLIDGMGPAGRERTGQPLQRPARPGLSKQ